MKQKSLVIPFRSIRPPVLPLWVAGVLLLGGGLAGLRAQPPISFLTGIPLQDRLRQPLTVASESSAALRPSLERLARSQRVAIFLDRRLDPHRPVKLQGAAESLEELLRESVRPFGADVSRLGPVLYVGPEQTAQKLATVLQQASEQLQQRNRSEQRRWQTTGPTAWPFLAEPRQLVQQWAQGRGVTLEGIDRIPHDLWSAQQLPSLDLLHQLTIVLAGFDLHVAFDTGGLAHILPIPERVAIERSYRLTESQWAHWPAWNQKFPAMVARRVGTTLVLSARSEQHERFVDWLQPTFRPDPVHSAPSSRRFTLTVRNQRRDHLVESLARQLQLDLEWLDVSDADKSRRVSLQVENVPLRALLQSAIGNDGLIYRLDGSRLIITPTSESREP